MVVLAGLEPALIANLAVESINLVVLPITLQDINLVTPAGLAPTYVYQIYNLIYKRCKLVVPVGIEPTLPFGIGLQPTHDPYASTKP